MFSRIIGETPEGYDTPEEYDTPKEYDTPEQAIIEGALDVLNSNDNRLPVVTNLPPPRDADEFKEEKRDSKMGLYERLFRC